LLDIYSDGVYCCFSVAKLTALLQKVFLSVSQEKTEDTLNSEVKTD